MKNKYKIEIEKATTGWLATLYVRRFWFFWYVVENSIEQLPYYGKVLDWQKVLNIPDSRIIILK